MVCYWYIVSKLIVQWIKNETILGINQFLQIVLPTPYNTTTYGISGVPLNGGGGVSILVSEDATHVKTISSFWTLDSAYGTVYTPCGRYFITIGT